MTTPTIPPRSGSLVELALALRGASDIVAAHAGSPALTPDPVQLRLLLAQVHDACDTAAQELDLVREDADTRDPADTSERVLTTAGVLDDVERERDRQHDKWGQQDHPDIAEELLQQRVSPDGMAERYRIPTAAEARSVCQYAAENGRLTFADILVEEVAEAVEAAALCNEGDLRDELVQVAAVAVAWIEAIDRRHNAKGGER